MILRISLVFLISILVGCMSTSHQNLLDETADYDGAIHAQQSLDAVNGAVFAPKRVEAKLTSAYIHPHEMSNGDFFLGGWVKTVVSHPYWDQSQPTFLKQGKPKSNSTQSDK